MIELARSLVFVGALAFSLVIPIGVLLTTSHAPQALECREAEGKGITCYEASSRRPRMEASVEVDGKAGQVPEGWRHKSTKPDTDSDDTHSSTEGWRWGVGSGSGQGDGWLPQTIAPNTHPDPPPALPSHNNKFNPDVAQASSTRLKQQRQQQGGGPGTGTFLTPIGRGVRWGSSAAAGYAYNSSQSSRSSDEDGPQSIELTGLDETLMRQKLRQMVRNRGGIADENDSDDQLAMVEENLSLVHSLQGEIEQNRYLRAEHDPDKRAVEPFMTQLMQNEAGAKGDRVGADTEDTDGDAAPPSHQPSGFPSPQASSTRLKQQRQQQGGGPGTGTFLTPIGRG
ncbi:unnamed protein product [Vitrella brassicaformis CCMP3155]|uniref:Uncharacterized protein n=1 Tax=Vitrella brassicaformis (strain CCMP3155) TaxID=1169540 RepID=A0A0G4H7T9_VITBC|nr:unnamed protein product [Vitrella brassicaformis CCMP3155]|eukprot:CEM39973.1 unnamed protein product [Vitrella brassicaformis CCMP3155]